MSFFNRFIHYINNENLFQKKDHILLAVSGGVDSVVLSELCKQAGFYFDIAHCNFQLRGAESERDEQFVRALADKYEARAFIKKFNTEKYASENKLSIQVAAREIRYRWFNELLNEGQDAGDEDIVVDGPSLQVTNIAHRPLYIVTAHHANDNIETVLMNFFKGTGIKGLRGILPRHGKLVRPLLFATKEELLSFAQENRLPYVEDSSNSSDKYTRNYFRNWLLPSVQKVFPQAEENLVGNIERFKETEILFQQAISQHKKKLLEYKGNELHIPVLKLLKTVPLKTVMYEIIKEYGFTAHQTGDVLNLLKSESGKYISSATHKIINNRKWIIIAPHNSLEVSLVLINADDKEVSFEMGKLTIERSVNIGYQPSTNHLIAVLDAKAVSFPLLLRKWKQGDYFYPLGMQKKKKLGRFFIDQKMSLIEKEQAWVIESDKKIAWILGRRIDDRFKITNNTKAILTIQFSAL